MMNARRLRAVLINNRWPAPARSALLTSYFLLFTLPLSAQNPPVQSTTPIQPTTPIPPPTQPFPEWLADVRTEALSRGISAATLDLAFADLAPDPVIIARDRAQPELIQSLDEYVAARLSPKNVDNGRAMLAQHAELLERIHKEYGVARPIMVAIWGAESNFGQITGTRPIITSLATLAYDSRRPALFRGELFQALTILDRGLVALPDLKGSWAGAMGQPQFMPSSYLKYAVDFDQDGHPNIWTSEADVLASMANYLKASGWTDGGRWGREVHITPKVLAKIERTVPMRTTGCGAMKAMTETRALSEWRRFGVMANDETPLPGKDTQASLVRGVNRYFLVYPNYHALLQYNCSNSYAIGIGLLSDAISEK